MAGKNDNFDALMAMMALKHIMDDTKDIEIHPFTCEVVVTPTSISCSSSGNKAYKHIETGVVIELCCKIFGKPEEILNKFDFTITKFAYYKEEVEDETGAVAKRQELPFETLEDEHFLEEIGISETHIEYKILMRFLNICILNGL